MSNIFAALAAPFPPDRVSWRVGSTNRDKTKGMALAYIDARDVQDRLDEAVGPANWQCRYPHATGKTVCEIGLRIDGEWIWKADGAGDTDVEAEKGALSDAFKRAAVRWGVGRYLYDLDSPWVEIEAAGKSYKISDAGHHQLRKVIGRTAHPVAARANVDPRPPEPQTAPPHERDEQAARAYLLKARQRIENPAQTEAELRHWWTSQGEIRRGLALTQTETDDLRDLLMIRLEQLKSRAA